MAVELQATKWLNITGPQAIKDNAAWTTTEIDTKGWDYAVVFLHYGTSDIAMAACKVQESDTSGSGFADVTGLDADGDTNTAGSAATLPTATDDNKFFLWEIDLRGRKRYLDLSITAGNGTNGTYASAGCILCRGSTAPSNTTASRGDVLDVLRV